jgi:type III pantothenate kinase
MKLCIDIGNSLCKLTLFNSEGKISENAFFSNEELDGIDSFVSNHSSIDSAIVSDVSGKFKSKDYPFPIHVLSHESTLPFTNLYRSPNTLGLDRIAVVAGAISLYPSKDVVVIDMGTCVTFDVANKEGQYLGGSISPGKYLRLKSLHEFTGKLPFVSDDYSPDMRTGYDTNSSILSGVVHGMQCEIEKRVEEYATELDEPIFLLCGGESSYFDFNPNLKIFAVPDLLALGLYNILKHNEL